MFVNNAKYLTSDEFRESRVYQEIGTVQVVIARNHLVIVVCQNLQGVIKPKEIHRLYHLGQDQLNFQSIILIKRLF